MRATKNNHWNKPVANMTKKTTFALALDIDGVLVTGKYPIAKAKNVIQRLFTSQNKIPFLLISNTCTPEPEKAHHLNKMFDCKSLTQLYGNKRIMLVGTEEYALQIAQQYGFKNYVTIQQFGKDHPYLYPYKNYEKDYEVGDFNKEEERIAAIFILRVPTDWGESLQIMLDLIAGHGYLPSHGKHEHEEIRVYLANPDVVYQDAYPAPRITTGAFGECLKALYEKIEGKSLEITLFGKPERITYEFSLQLLEEQAKSLGYSGIHAVYAVGDNPYSDIQGANTMGWYSILTRTGCFTGPENHHEHPAKLVVNDVEDALDFICNKEEVLV